MHLNSAPNPIEANTVHRQYQRDRLIQLPEVRHLTGIGKTSIYKLIGSGQFPRPAKIGSGSSRWSENAILEWIGDQLEQASC